MKRILLHICCGPCAIYPWQILEQEGFYVEGLFYNPNIQPYEEYQSRLSALKELGQTRDLVIHYGEYEEKEYKQSIRSAAGQAQRCGFCFGMRLEKVSGFASEKGFDFFTTTLLISPYQDQNLIREAGFNVSQGSTKARFLFYDFRPGFKQAQAKAKELKLYRQKYCGCLASLAERNSPVKIDK